MYVYLSATSAVPIDNNTELQSTSKLNRHTKKTITKKKKLSNEREMSNNLTATTCVNIRALYYCNITSIELTIVGLSSYFAILFVL